MREVRTEVRKITNIKTCPLPDLKQITSRYFNSLNFGSNSRNDVEKVNELINTLKGNSLRKRKSRLKISSYEIIKQDIVAKSIPMTRTNFEEIC